MNRNFSNGISIYKLNRYSVFIFAYILMAFFSNSLFSQTSQISINKIPQKISFQKFGNAFFISLKDLSDLLIIDSDKLVNDNRIQLSNEILKFSPNSFFVVYQNDTILRVAQMSQPSLENGNELFIPVIPFFIAMNGIDLIKSNINGKQIDIISKLIFTKNIYADSDNFIFNKSMESKLIEINDSLVLIESDLLLIDNPLIIENNMEPRSSIKNIEIKKSDIKYSKLPDKSKLKDSTKKETQINDVFLYDTKKDEINPKSYTIPKDLKKPK